MRLINTNTLCFEDFLDEEKIPAYAILSHTWGTEEVNYQEMRVGWFWRLFATRWKKGYEKIELTCRQALTDGLAYCWVDTCCIDKTSSAELSEAINSMFRWYAKAAVCYAFLPDVNVVEGCARDLDKSRWFTRGCKYHSTTHSLCVCRSYCTPHAIVLPSRITTLLGETDPGAQGHCRN